MLQYRGDIDGLRAVAVLLVVPFHCGFDKFVPGGFIGVDIFFVISGFLITRIIYPEIEDGNFNLFEFYSRRIRRLFPSLFLVLISILVLSFFLLMPSDILQVEKDILSSVFFVSNIVFYINSNYFNFGQFNPVLHTLSLSVEE